MYVQETVWFKKQQRKRTWVKVFGFTVMCFTLVLFACIGILSLPFNHQLLNCDVKNKNIPDRVLAFEVVEGAYEKTHVEIDNIESKSVPKQEIVMQETINHMNDGVNIVAIDIGHGGTDEGCSYKGVEEKEINLKLGYMLKEKLENIGFQVILTRSADESLDLYSRVERVKEERADILISIHQNACDDSTVSGIETWYYPDGVVENERLARLIQQYTILYTKGKDRGIMESGDLVMVRECGIPACLVETGFLSNDIERQNLLDENYCNKLVQGMTDAIELFFYPKTMYLTFDDGPNTQNTNAILDKLKEKGIKATFFVVGKNVERNPETTKRIVEEGHAIGIHCYNHEYGVIYNSVDAYVEDFEKARQIVYEVTGVETNLFRFPGGSINSYNKKVYKDIIEEMTARGYVYFDWNASLEDAVKKPNREKILKNAKESTYGRKVVVMLAHDTVDLTVEILDELLDMFPEYKFKELNMEVEQIRF